MRIATSLITVLALSIVSAACATTGGEDGYSATEDEAAGTGKLTFWQASDSQWHFNLKSGNGSILLTSEAYTSRTGSINGALSVLANGVDPAMYRVEPAASGYVVHLLAANYETIGFSEVYATKSSATRAITSCVRAVTTYLDKREAASAGKRAEIGAGPSGQYHFNFHAGNGQIVLSSESYTTEAAAYNGAFAVQQDGQSAAAYTVHASASGSFYFTVKADNGQIIGISQQYTTKSNAQAGADALVKLLPAITVL
ncbi:MAG: YegP family protein [Kofleriaceae bacterium]